jgi:GntR family transcriptional repressor for pyruvate dehydrogenase complex
VTSLAPELLLAHLDFVFVLTDATFLELFEARRSLEPGIVALAAARIGDAEIAALEACMARAAALVDDHAAFAEVDLEIHTRIAKAAGNAILARFLSSLSQLGAASRQRTVALPGVARRSLEDHQAIIAALKRRDPAAAQAAMLDHLRRVEAALQQLGASARP